MISKTIFRAYDIRGVYKEDLTKETAKLIGKGFGSYLGGDIHIVVGRDNRTHSENLQNAFIEGLLSTGCHVTNIGLATSPLLYFANVSGKFEAGCNITASHNPPKYNGFKFIAGNAHSICGDEIQEILKIIQNENFREAQGETKEKDFFEEYKTKLLSLFQYEKKLKVVIDTGNGIAGKFYPDVILSAGHEIIELFTELDGTFPNHQPDPIVEKNLKTLKETIKNEHADIGIAFDGDGDRVGIVDNEGNFHNSDALLTLFSRDVLTRHPGSKIVFTVSNSQSLFSDIKNHGGFPIMCPVGHSFVENTMTREDAILGGEQSGHFFLKEDYFSYDDALVAAMRLLKILSESGKTASELFSEIPKVFSEPEIRPFVPDHIKFDTMKKIKEYFVARFVNNTMDGIRIDFGDDAWGSIRVSNTSPRMSICLEAKNPEKLEEIKRIVLDQLHSYPEIDWGK